uniref:Uncharacterized protein n=1 Tax=Citrobacter freundii TaxID=546 RepID=A0A2R4AKJ9_CITFR|nr:hypothetical protein [Citrobacter freundii]
MDGDCPRGGQTFLRAHCARFSSVTLQGWLGIGLLQYSTTKLGTAGWNAKI